MQLEISGVVAFSIMQAEILLIHPALPGNRDPIFCMKKRKKSFVTSVDSLIEFSI